MIILHLGCYESVKTQLPFIYCRKGQICKGPFQWFPYFSVYQNKSETTLFKVPGSSDGKESTCKLGELGSVLWTERPGELQPMGLQRLCD